MNIGNASLQEILWTAVAFVGVILRIYSFRDSFRDREIAFQQLDDGGSKTLLVVANATLRTEVTGLVFKLSIFVIGLVFMFSAPSPTQGSQARQWLLAGVFISLVVIMNINSYLNTRARHLVREIERQREEKGK